eukprot:1157756-Pelagomonas_calceolata.AAC.4
MLLSGVEIPVNTCSPSGNGWKEALDWEPTWPLPPDLALGAHDLNCSLWLAGCGGSAQPC